MNHPRYALRKLLVTLFAAVFAISLTACTQFDTSEKETLYYQPKYDIDINDSAELIGNADFYFIGTVKSIAENKYRAPITVDLGKGPQEVNDPYTVYQLRVVENIKGELDQIKTIHVTKTGGMLKDRSAILLPEGDKLPTIGKTYAIAVVTEEDGRLLAKGPTAFEEVPDDIVNSTDGDRFEQYKAKAAQEKPIERKRYDSVYHKDYGAF